MADRQTECSLITCTAHDLLPAGFPSLCCVQTYLNIKENRVINSWVAEGEHWRLEGEDEPSVKFRGATIELHLNWLDSLTFSDGDAYTWDKVAPPA